MREGGRERKRGREGGKSREEGEGERDIGNKLKGGAWTINLKTPDNKYVKYRQGVQCALS